MRLRKFPPEEYQRMIGVANRKFDTESEILDALLPGPGADDIFALITTICGSLVQLLTSFDASKELYLKHDYYLRNTPNMLYYTRASQGTMRISKVEYLQHFKNLFLMGFPRQEMGIDLQVDKEIVGWTGKFYPNADRKAAFNWLFAIDRWGQSNTFDRVQTLREFFNRQYVKLGSWLEKSPESSTSTLLADEIVGPDGPDDSLALLRKDVNIVYQKTAELLTLLSIARDNLDIIVNLVRAHKSLNAIVAPQAGQNDMSREISDFSQPSAASGGRTDRRKSRTKAELLHILELKANQLDSGTERLLSNQRSRSNSNSNGTSQNQLPYGKFNPQYNPVLEGTGGLRSNYQNLPYQSFPPPIYQTNFHQVQAPGYVVYGQTPMPFAPQYSQMQMNPYTGYINSNMVNRVPQNYMPYMFYDNSKQNQDFLAGVNRRTSQQSRGPSTNLNRDTSTVAKNSNSARGNRVTGNIPTTQPSEQTTIQEQIAIEPPVEQNIQTENQVLTNDQIQMLNDFVQLDADAEFGNAQDQPRAPAPDTDQTTAQLPSSLASDLLGNPLLFGVEGPTDFEFPDNFFGENASPNTDIS